MLVDIKGIVPRYKVLMSSLVIKVGTRSTGIPSIRDAEIDREHVWRKDFVDDRVEKLMIFSYGQPKDKNTDR